MSIETIMNHNLQYMSPSIPPGNPFQSWTVYMEGTALWTNLHYSASFWQSENIHPQCKLGIRHQNSLCVPQRYKNWTCTSSTGQKKFLRWLQTLAQRVQSNDAFMTQPVVKSQMTPSHSSWGPSSHLSADTVSALTFFIVYAFHLLGRDSNQDRKAMTLALRVPLRPILFSKSGK